MKLALLWQEILATLNCGTVSIKMSERRYFNLEKIKIIVAYKRLLKMSQREVPSELSYYSLTLGLQAAKNIDYIKK